MTKTWCAVLGLLALTLAACSTQAEQAGEGAQQSGSPSVSQALKAKSRAVRNGPRNSPTVAITLDADYSPAAKARVESGDYPPQVNEAAIDVLEETGTPATVFATGMWVSAYPQAVRRLAANSRIEFANHTWNHDAWTKTCYGLPYVGDDDAKRESLRRTSAVITESTGQTPFFVRMPGLCQSKEDIALMAREGLQLTNTDVVTTDAFATDSATAAKNMLKQVRPGSILLMHLNGGPNAPETAEILKRLIPGLRAKGLQPVTLRTMFSPRPADRG